MLKQFLKDKKGSTAMMFAIAAPVFIGGIAFAVELGHWQQKRSKLQDIADASALAAAQEIMVLGDNANYVFAGKGHAYENGFNFTNGKVVVTYPPLTGDYADENAVEVVTTKTQSLFFAKYFGVKALELETRATAIVLEGGDSCVLALHPSDSEVIQVGGSAALDLDGCRVHSNSSALNSIDVTNITADCISAVGGIRTTSATVLTDCPEPLDYTRPVRDPYADVKIPDGVETMPCLTATGGGKKSDTVLAKAGRYCTSMTVSSNLIFDEPGVYYLDGASLTMKSSTSIIYGAGVTIVFMNGSSFFGSNGGDIRLTPSTVEPFAGMALYFDSTGQPSEHVTLNGNNSTNIVGVIYAPHVNIKMNGGANLTSECTQIIANKVWFSGNSGFTNSGCDAVPGVRRIKSDSGAMLVE